MKPNSLAVSLSQFAPRLSFGDDLLTQYFLIAESSYHPMMSIGGQVPLCLLFVAYIFSTACVHIDDVNGCIAKDFGYGSVVCVCNSTYCDEIAPLKKPPSGHYIVFTSAKDGLRFHQQQHNFIEEHLPRVDMVLSLHPDKPRQTILGFGGAFSDATGININSLSSHTKQNLMKAYFSKIGIEYNLCRVPIGGTDFSTRPYTYNDDQDGDFGLKHFSLAPEDLQHKIPLILEAQKLNDNKVKLVASPWSAPSWMKTNGMLHGLGYLKGEPGGPYYETWANYFVRFFKEYESHNVSFWGLTAQNTPAPLIYGESAFNNMRFTPENQGKFISRHLGPTLRENGLTELKIIIGDGVRMMQPKWTEDVLNSNAEVSDFVAGTAFHWYTDKVSPPSILTELHEKFPEKFILATEACEGVGIPPYVFLGSWERGENYADDIIQDLQHWAIGWIDWNMVLDSKGGPNWSNNFVDSAVIVDAENDQFFKQPMFYALGHFSKFISPGSVILDTSSSATLKDIAYVGARTPENTTVVVILNKSGQFYNIAISDSTNIISAEILPHSIQTYVF